MSLLPSFVFIESNEIMFEKFMPTLQAICDGRSYFIKFVNLKMHMHTEQKGSCSCIGCVRKCVGNNGKQMKIMVKVLHLNQSMNTEFI